MSCAEFLQDKVLRKVRVLILVHHDIQEPVSNGIQSLRTVSEQYVHIQQDVIEIHDVGLLALPCIESVYLADFRLFRRRIVLDGLRISGISIGSDKIVLRHGYAAEHILRLVYLLVKLELFQTCLYGTRGITRVVYGKVLLVAEVLGEFPEKPDENGMECSHIQPAGRLLAHHQSYPFFHLGGCLLRESQRQDLLRRTACIKDMGYPAGQNPRLSGPCSGHYEHRPIYATYRLLLLII